jgi:hypothetical protein
MATTGITLADLTLSDLEAAIGDAQIDAIRTHAVTVAVCVRARLDASQLVLDLSATTVASTVTRSVVSDECWFAKRWQADGYLSSLMASVVASAVAQMDMAAAPTSPRV